MFEAGDRVRVTVDYNEPESVYGKYGTVVESTKEPDAFLQFVNVDLDDKDFNESYMSDRNWIWLFLANEIAHVEQYEFMGYLSDNDLNDWSYALRYRCYRGGCNGSAVQTADRNTHNGYHNRNGH